MRVAAEFFVWRHNPEVKTDTEQHSVVTRLIEKYNHTDASNWPFFFQSIHVNLPEEQKVLIAVVDTSSCRCQFQFNL